MASKTKTATACQSCYDGKRKCIYDDDSGQCTRCKKLKLTCVPRQEKRRGRRRSTSPPVAPVAPCASKAPEDFFFGEHMDDILLNAMTTWPSDHAALRVTLRYFASLAKTVNSPKTLARVLHIATKSGNDMAAMTAAAEAAAAGLHINPMISWEDISREYGPQHINAIREAHVSPIDPRIAFATSFTINSLSVWTSDALVQWLYNGPVETLPAWKMTLAQPCKIWKKLCDHESYMKIVHGFVHLVNASNEFGTLRTVHIGRLHFVDGCILNAIMSICYANDSSGTFFMDLVQTFSPTINGSSLSSANVEPFRLGDRWSMCDSDVNLLEQMLSDEE